MGLVWAEAVISVIYFFKMMVSGGDRRLYVGQCLNSFPNRGNLLSVVNNSKHFLAIWE